MSALWRAMSGRFDGLAMRERVFVAVAVLAVLAFLIHTWWLGPQLARRDASARQLSQQRSELEALSQQLVALESQAGDPDGALKARLRDLMSRAGETDSRLKEVERSLVAPSAMPKLLQDLIAARKGLRLLALRSLPVTHLSEPAARAPQATKGEGEKFDSPLGIFKHGVEISLQGEYLDLLAYLADIERLPQRLYWSTASLRTDDYPRSTLTVTVYTMSLDRTWLSV